MFLIDTNVFSELMRPAALRDKHVFDWVASQPVERVRTSAITVAEVMYGIERLPPADQRRGGLRDAAVELFDVLFRRNVIAFDADAARAFAQLAAARRGRSSSIIASNDLLIASVAAVHGLTVVTRNVRDFVGLEIPILNPWENARP